MTDYVTRPAFKKAERNFSLLDQFRFYLSSHLQLIGPADGWVISGIQRVFSSASSYFFVWIKGWYITPSGQIEATSPLHSYLVTSVTPVGAGLGFTVEIQKRSVATISTQQVQLSTVEDPHATKRLGYIGLSSGLE